MPYPLTSTTQIGASTTIHVHRHSTQRIIVERIETLDMRRMLAAPTTSTGGEVVAREESHRLIT